MIRYLDTSVLVKRYVHEVGSEDVHKLFREKIRIATCRVAWLEIHSALSRRTRDGFLKPVSFKRIAKQVASDFESLHVVEVTPELLRSAAALCRTHPLRSLDALHLASALWIHNELNTATEFHAQDKALSTAAKKAGLPTPGMNSA